MKTTPEQSKSPRKSLADQDDDDFNYWEEAEESDDIKNEWKRFVHRIRVHEMLKCLREEHKKLKALREHTDLEDILLAKFREINKSLRDGDEYSDENVDNDDETAERKKEQAAIRHEDNIITKHADTLFVRTKKEEMTAMAEMYPDLKRVKADSKYIAKAALRMFRSRSHLTEQEFQSIIDLCDVKFPSVYNNNLFVYMFYIMSEAKSMGISRASN